MSGKIMDILNNPEMMKKLTDALGTVNSQQNAGNSPSGTQSADELMVNARNIMNTLNHTDDRRINLLNALRPYLRESRTSGVDRAIQMLKITKLADLFKSENQ